MDKGLRASALIWGARWMARTTSNARSWTSLRASPARGSAASRGFSTSAACTEARVAGWGLIERFGANAFNSSKSTNFSIIHILSWVTARGDLGISVLLFYEGGSAFFKFTRAAHKPVAGSIRLCKNEPAAGFFEARFQLYRRRFLRPNTHFAAFFEIYKIYIPLHRSKFKNLAKSHFFQNFMKFLGFLSNLNAFRRNFPEILSEFDQISSNFKRKPEKTRKKPAAGFFLLKISKKASRWLFLVWLFSKKLVALCSPEIHALLFLGVFSGGPGPQLPGWFLAPRRQWLVSIITLRNRRISCRLFSTVRIISIS